MMLIIHYYIDHVFLLLQTSLFRCQGDLSALPVLLLTQIIPSTVTHETHTCDHITRHVRSNRIYLSVSFSCRTGYMCRSRYVVVPIFLFFLLPGNIHTPTTRTNHETEPCFLHVPRNFVLLGSESIVTTEFETGPKKNYSGERPATR